MAIASRVIFRIYWGFLFDFISFTLAASNESTAAWALSWAGRAAASSLSAYAFWVAMSLASFSHFTVIALTSAYFSSASFCSTYKTLSKASVFSVASFKFFYSTPRSIFILLIASEASLILLTPILKFDYCWSNYLYFIRYNFL